MQSANAGATREPPTAAESYETELRAELEAIDGLPGWRSVEYKPGVFRIVNPNGRSSKIIVNGVRTAEHAEARRKRVRRMGWKPEMHTQIPTPRNMAARRNATQVVNEILANLPKSTVMLYRQARSEAGAAVMRKGRNGRVWKGDIYALFRTVWPGLPDTRVHPDSMRVTAELIPEMAAKGLMYPDVNAPGSGAQWWVADEHEVDLTVPAAPVKAAPVRFQAPTPPPEAPERVAAAATAVPAPAPAAETAPAPAPKPVADPTPQEAPVKVHTCPDCSFADRSAQAVTTHRARTPATHPTDEGAPFKCPEPGCGAVRATVATYSSHLRSKHGKQGMMCRHPSCLRWFGNEIAFNTHKNQSGHGNPSGKHLANKDTAGQPPAKSVPTATEVEMTKQPAPPARASTPNGAAPPAQGAEVTEDDVIAMVRRFASANTFQRRYEDLRGDHEALQSKYKALEEEAANLREFKRRAQSLLAGD